MLNVANWTDKQLDELSDLLKTADYSAVAQFICNGFLARGSRIMTDPYNTDLRLTVGADTKTVVLSPGVFQHGGYVSQIDTSQVINILDTASGTWGIGQISDLSPRWDIVCVKWNEQLHTVQKRWFVNDTVVPNTYYQQDVNTLINKTYYDIVVVHGIPGSGVVPDAPAGFWTIGEILIPAGSSAIIQSNIHDTGTPGGSSHVPPNWVGNTRIMRLEYYGWFEPGTRLPFHQASAPIGWYQDVTLNDKALRVVSGSGGGGGGVNGLSTSFTSTGGHILTADQIPGHTHPFAAGQGSSFAGHGTHTEFYYCTPPTAGNTGVNTPNGNPHLHSLNISLAYVDVIICTKG